MSSFPLKFLPNERFGSVIETKDDVDTTKAELEVEEPKNHELSVTRVNRALT